MIVGIFLINQFMIFIVKKIPSIVKINPIIIIIVVTGTTTFTAERYPLAVVTDEAMLSLNVAVGKRLKNPSMIKYIKFKKKFTIISKN